MDKLLLPIGQRQNIKDFVIVVSYLLIIG